MFRPSYLLFIPLLASAVHADPLKAADKEALLEKLDKLNDTANSKVDSRAKTAAGAFRTALASDAATLELYLKCVEKVEYDDANKKAQDFREWKRKQQETLEKPAFKAALHYQLNWLVLTLEAAGSKGKPPGINAKMEALVDSIYGDPDRVKDAHDELAKSATDSVFARAYEIRDLKIEDWPNSPLDLATIFDRNLIAQYRTPGHATQLRAEWMKWIKYEGVTAEKWPGESQPRGGGGGGRGGRGGRGGEGGGGGDGGAQDLEHFQNERYPVMLWNMEVDAFKNGDQQVAAGHMLTHIEKYVSHPKAASWAKQFRSLVTGRENDDSTPARKSTPAPEPAEPEAGGSDAPDSEAAPDKQ